MMTLRLTLLRIQADAPGNSGTTLAGSGPWTLADDQSISGFTSHTYTIVVNVSIDLTDGVGDDTYTPCTEPQAGEGLYNLAELDLKQ